MPRFPDLGGGPWLLRCCQVGDVLLEDPDRCSAEFDVVERVLNDRAGDIGGGTGAEEKYVDK